MTLQVPGPILLTKEGKWFVASCPLLDIATQGRTEREVKENLADLIYEYLRDPDTAKPSLDALMSLFGEHPGKNSGRCLPYQSFGLYRSVRSLKF
jgi:predicted RNase H-like HicB family nuclease